MTSKPKPEANSAWDVMKPFKSYARDARIPFPDSLKDRNCGTFCSLVDSVAGTPAHELCMAANALVGTSCEMMESMGAGPGTSSDQRKLQAYHFVRSFIACAFSKAPLYNNARASLLLQAQPPDKRASLIQLLGFMMQFSRESLTKVPEQFLPDEWWSEANLHQLRWDKEVIKTCLQVSMECEGRDSDVSELLCTRYLDSACAQPPSGCSDHISRRRPLDQVLQDPACLSQLWAALRSTNPRVFPCAVRVLKCLISDGRTCVALTASANSPNGCPPPSSFSSLMQMGGAEPLAAALKHLAQQKQMQRRYQQQLKQVGMATYEMAREAPDLIEALENAWACDVAYSQHHTLVHSSLTKDSQGRDVPAFWVEGSDEQKQLEADSSLPSWPSELLEAHMSLLLTMLDIIASDQTGNLMASPGLISTVHLTRYPRASHAAAACFLEGNPWAAAALLKYMLKAGKDAIPLAPPAPDPALRLNTNAYNPRGSFDVSMLCGMGLKFLNQMLVAGNSSKLLKLLPRKKLQDCITHTLQACITQWNQAARASREQQCASHTSNITDLHAFDIVKGCGGPDLASACVCHALQLLSNVCSTADGLAYYQAWDSDYREMVRVWCEKLGWRDANLRGVELRESSREAARSAGQGGSCSGKGAQCSVQKAGETGISSSSTSDTAQGNQGNNSSSSSSSSSATNDRKGSSSKSIPVKVGSPSCSGSTSDIAKKQAHGNGSSSHHATGLKQSRVSQACVQCGKMAKLRRCARCGQALVCSEDCQRALWPTHKLACKKGTL